MLPFPAPYPYVGSYALIELEGETQLARTVFRRSARSVGEGGRVEEIAEVVVSLPLRRDASGNLTVEADRLIDGTPLTAEEEREFHALDRHLAGRCGRTVRQRRQIARRDALKRRMLACRLLERKLAELRAVEEATLGRGGPYGRNSRAA